MIYTREVKNLVGLILLICVGLVPVVFADDFMAEEEEATAADTFIIGASDSGGDINLQFGSVLGEYLRWDVANARFQLSADLDLAAAQLINSRLENLVAAPLCNGAAIGRMYFNTTAGTAYACDGTTWLDLGSAGSPQPMATARYADSSTTNINALATDNIIPWDTEDFEDAIFTHDAVTNNSRVQVTETAKYLVSGAVSIYSTSARYNGILKFRINGATTLGPTFQPGYIRNASGQNETSLTFSLILDLTANDYFEVLVDRESSTGAATLISGASSLSVVQLQGVGGSGGGSVPFVSSSSLIVPPSTTQTISVIGTTFVPTSVVSFPGFGGIINSTTVISPTQIDVNVTTTATEAAYDIVVNNSGDDNTVWVGNGVGAFEVAGITGTGPAGTYTESFETDLGSWVDSGLDVAWTRDSGGTPSGNTGPTVASAGTFYVFTEASNPNFPNFEFGLETTNFNIAQSVSFDYHMFGADMGTLEIQTQFGGVWTTRFTLVGQQQVAQGDAYINQLVDLSAFPVEGIRLFYTSGANYTGDCTLDNISIIST